MARLISSSSWRRRWSTAASSRRDSSSAAASAGSSGLDGAAPPPLESAHSDSWIALSQRRTGVTHSSRGGGAAETTGGGLLNCRGGSIQGADRSTAGGGNIQGGHDTTAIKYRMLTQLIIKMFFFLRHGSTITVTAFSSILGYRTTATI